MARRFQFRLQPVLRYRKMQEEEKLRDFAEANRRVEEARLALEEMGEERASYQNDIRTLYAKHAAFNQVAETYRYINGLQVQMKQSAVKLLELDKAAQEKRAHYIDARRARRALEILEERQKEEFDKEVDRQEQNLLDELGIQSMQRRRHEEE